MTLPRPWGTLYGLPSCELLGVTSTGAQAPEGQEDESIMAKSWAEETTLASTGVGF